MEYADLLLIGGVVYTADPQLSWADSVAVRGRRIAAVGRSADLLALRGPQTEVVELAGRAVVPGFTESHLHLVDLAMRAQQVEATGSRSASEVVERLARRMHGTDMAGWVRGGGWDANIWSDGLLPHKSLLDSVSGDVPVALDSKDLHSMWVNSAALSCAGVTETSPDVPGGVIERDSDGKPSGVLRDTAVQLIQKAIPAIDLETAANAVHAAIPRLWSTGIVAVHNASDTVDGLALRTFQWLRDQGLLGVRVLQQLPAANLARAVGLGLRSGFGDAWLRIGGIKIFADGALGSRTANMLEGYLGEPTNLGVAATEPDLLMRQGLEAVAAGLSLSVHAIGDRAVRNALDVFTEIRRRDSPSEGHGQRRLRHRIEHVQCMSDEDLPRLAALGVFASVQPIHCTSDIDLVERHWGEPRARAAYRFRDLLDSGAQLVFGSDGPIEPHAPLLGIHAAVTRRRLNGDPGPEGWQGGQRIRVDEALDAYTRWPAYLAGDECQRGTITPGKLADLVVLAEDIFAVAPMEICHTPVDLTVLDGQAVWRRRD